MPIEVGDAIFRFLGDSQNLDTKFAEVAPNAKAAFEPAAQAAEDASERIQFSMKEARGEVRLIGEEIGVRLPRHVGNFLAELPGVGPALSAAFSATAVVFLAQALVEVTKKVADFASEHFIFTQAMKDSNFSIAETNKLLLEQSANYNKAKDALDKFGASGSDGVRLQLEALKEQLKTQQAIFAQGPQRIDQAKQISHEYITQTSWLGKAYEFGRSIVTGTKEHAVVLHEAVGAAENQYNVANATVKALQEQQVLLEKQLTTEHALEAVRQQGETGASGARLRAAKRQAEVAEDADTASKREKIAEQLENELYLIKRDGMMKQLAVLKENDANTKDAQAKLLAELKAGADAQATVVVDRFIKANDELQKTLQDMAKTVHDAPPIDIITPAAVQRLLDARAAAQSLGVTLRSDLVSALASARLAREQWLEAGIKDNVVEKEFVDRINAAKTALENFGHSQDTLKVKTETTWKGFTQDLKQGANAMHEFSGLGEQLFNQLSKSIESSLESVILAQGNIGKALEQATAKALASLASQALVKSLFYTAEGFAALAGFEETSASQYFIAAGEMAAVGAAAGIATHSMAGGGGGSSTASAFQNNNGGSNTSQAGRGGSSVVGVQHFAEGGLITAPTLAMIGEQNRREAVLPLEDPRAMGEVGKAIGSAGGGGGVHIHLPHGSIISADTMQKFVAKMNKMVGRGQLNVKSSNSLRINKRSA
jgi:hypothetical protein